MKKILIYVGIIVLMLGSLITALILKKCDKLENAYDSVVYIESIDDETIKSGSGFVYKIKDGINYVVTSYHVIEGYTDIYIYNNNKDKAKAKILDYDEYTDIAILSIEDNLDLKEANIGNSGDINIDDKIYIVGTPIDISNINTISHGKISSANKEKIITTTHGSSNLNTIQVKAKVDNGNSGGPLLNDNNEVIGMMFIKENDEVSYALPIDFVMNIVKRLENNELERPNLGAVMCNSTNIELLSEYEINVDNINGVVVLEVIDNYPLNIVGLLKGDIITKFNDIEISNVNELREELYKKTVGDIIVIEYYREGKYNTVEVKL